MKLIFNLLTLTVLSCFLAVGCQKQNKNSPTHSNNKASSSKTEKPEPSTRKADNESNSQSATSKKSPLRNWQELTKRGPCFGLKAEQIRNIIGLKTPPTKNTEFEECKFEWKDGNNRRYIRVSAVVKNSDADTLLANAKVAKKVAEESTNSDTVDLSKHGVWAFWKRQRGKGILTIYTQKMMLQISTRNAFDKGEQQDQLAKEAATKIAEQMFAN